MAGTFSLATLTAIIVVLNFYFAIYQNHLLNLYYSFDPVYDVLHFSSDTAGILYMLAYHAIVFLVCYVLFYLGVKRRVGGGELRICVDANKKMEA